MMNSEMTGMTKTEMDMDDKTITSPVKAIRAKCLDCCCGNPNEVRLCVADGCPLYPFRFGKNPFVHRREYSEEERAAMAARLAEARAKIRHDD